MYEDRPDSKKHLSNHTSTNQKYYQTPDHDDHASNDENYNKLMRENQNLRSSLKELQQKMTAMTSSKDARDRPDQKKVQEYKDKHKNMSKYIETLETELESCQKNLDFMQDVLKKQIVGGLESTEELLKELDKVDDPFAIVLINRIINTYNKKDGSNKGTFRMRQTSNGESEHSVYKALEDSQKRVKRLELENKALITEIETSKSQNDFLLNQLSFTQKKLEERDRRSHHSNGSEADSILSQICEIFGIRDQDRILECVNKICKAYEYLPSLQTTIENIFTIVTEKSCIQVEVNSNEQLVEIIDIWSSNLVDYQNLVVELFEVMNIRSEDKKHRTHLIHSIKQLMEDRNDIENSIIGSSEIVDELKKLKKQAMGIEFFVDEAKARLGLEEPYSNEALFSKVLKFLDGAKGLTLQSDRMTD